MEEKDYPPDRMDVRILGVLQSHGNDSIADIAAKVGLSQTPCWRRIKQLQKLGVISERAWILDPVKLGLTVNVFAQLKLKQHDEETLEQLEAATREWPEIVECFSMSGESDYLLRVLVRSVEQYESFLKKVLLHLPGVASIHSNFALKAVKSTTRLPL